MARTPGENIRTRMLRKILVEKVVTETELYKMFGSCNRTLRAIELAYQFFVSSGFPIRRRALVKKWTQSGKTTSSCNRGKIYHRVVIYYVE